MIHDPVKRRLLRTVAGLAVCGTSLARGLLTPTPRQSAGPFYPVERPLDDDNDLTRVRGQQGIASGEITDLSGHVRDVSGRPIRDARIEIWQCDAHGRYRHPRERGAAPIDAAFQGFGHTHTDVLGGYRFRTIKPVSYPGRTPHIHIAVFTSAVDHPFVTQLYNRAEPGNTDDFLFNRIPVERRHLVLADFRAAEGADVEYRAGFDIILHPQEGTPAS
jgi:protocatechuate 3,4-dioxygenase beta subunit